MVEYKCIHLLMGKACNKPAFNARTHGWFCLNHYRTQQSYIPDAPRLPQSRWKGAPLTKDEDIIADILATDAARIAAGTVTVVRFGAVEPLYIRYVN